MIDAAWCLIARVGCGLERIEGDVIAAVKRRVILDKFGGLGPRQCSGIVLI